jgi:hypothetical protein
VSGLDFAALGTGMDIRQALDVLDDPHPSWEDCEGAVAVVRARVEELETRLNTARRTAWVAVPVEAETVGRGDIVVRTDGTLALVIDAEHFSETTKPVRLEMEAGPDFGRQVFRLERDRPVPVLRRPTADALDILTRQLGAQAM